MSNSTNGDILIYQDHVCSFQFKLKSYVANYLGMPNASIPTPEPVKQRKMFGAYGKAVGKHSVAFVSQVNSS